MVISKAVNACFTMAMPAGEASVTLAGNCIGSQAEKALHSALRGDA